MNPARLSPADPKGFFTKNDPLDPRLGDRVERDWAPNRLKKNDFVVIGYPDDEGVALNGGRVGAKEGPDSFRMGFYKMTPALSGKRTSSARLFDAGNVTGGDLKSRHELAETSVFEALEKKARVFTIGGGHDYGYSDFSAFCRWANGLKKIPFIVNFDAHLDVRSDERGPHSGTPFFRLLEKYSKIEFHEVGIQEWCNSRVHLEWLKKKRGRCLTFEEFVNSPLDLTAQLKKFLFKKFNAKKHLLGVSIDVDGFASSDCPGASQVFPVGLSVQEFYRTWTSLILDFEPKLVGVYELNPGFDVDQRTAKFCGILAHRYFFR